MDNGKDIDNGNGAGAGKGSVVVKMASWRVYVWPCHWLAWLRAIFSKEQSIILAVATTTKQVNKITDRGSEGSLNNSDGHILVNDDGNNDESIAVTGLSVLAILVTNIVM